MKKSKLLRTMALITVYCVTLITISMILYIVKIPYLSPDTLFSPTNLAIATALLACSPKVRSFINCKA